MKKINQLLLKLRKPPHKKNHNQIYQVLKVRQSKKSMSNENSKIKASYQNLRLAINNKNSWSGKISLLTTVPLEWSIRKMTRELNVSCPMALRAKKLIVLCTCTSYGYKARFEPKTDRNIEDSTLEKIESFYLSDEASWIMPGMKNYILSMKNSKYHQE